MKIKLQSGELTVAGGPTKLKLLPPKINAVQKKTDGKKSRVQLAPSTVRYKENIQTRNK